MINPLVELALGRIHVGDTLETYQLRFLFCICSVLLRIRFVFVRRYFCMEKLRSWYVSDMASTHS